MVRGGRGGYPSRGNPYRGSNRGNSSWNGGGFGRSSPDRFSFGGKYGSERYSRIDDYTKPYRVDGGYGRDRHSPERKRLRMEGSRGHDSYGGSYNSSSRYDSYPSERRGYAGERERHVASSSPYSPRREEFRKPAPPSPRGSFRGRLSSRGSRGGRRERGAPLRRRLADRSYAIRKRGLIRVSERRAKIIRLRSRRKRDTSKEKIDDDEEKEEKEDKEKDEKAEGEDDAEMKEGEENEGEEKKEGKETEGEDKPKEKKEKVEEEKSEKKKFIKLVCPQCNVKVSTFRGYEAHLHGRTHKLSMRKVAMKQRSILAQMRQAQRNAQNELEKNSSEQLATHSQFCPLCKLNFKQLKAVHQGTQAHKNMKKFLMPYCKVCKVTYKSPMMYENHLCSIEHLKRKQRSAANDGSAEEDNLEDFTTIDSVGEIEENAGSDEDKVKEEEVSVGIEQVKKVEAYFCDLCRMYLPRAPEEEYPDILSTHCRKRFHMQRYVRHKENEDLKKRAEKLQRKETAEKEKKKEVVEAKKEGDNENVAGNESKEEGEAKDEGTKVSEDDKLWEAVDKDLGELLGEADGNKSDDDDDDSRVNGERFDRFKSDEKDKSGEENKGSGESGAAAEKVEDAKKATENK